MADTIGPERTDVAPTVAPTTRPSTRFRVLERDGFRCRYCGKSSDQGAVLEVDHLYPKSKGGSHSIDNLVTACWECNRGKAGRPLLGQPKPKEWGKVRRRRYRSVAPVLAEEWPEGSHCATPLKIALLGYQLNHPNYDIAWRYFRRLQPDFPIPPKRHSDDGWFDAVKRAMDEHTADLFVTEDTEAA